MPDSKNKTDDRGALAAGNARATRFDAFTVFTQVLAWSAALSQVALVLYLLAV